MCAIDDEEGDAGRQVRVDGACGVTGSERQMPVPLLDGLLGGPERIADLGPGQARTSGAVNPVPFHAGQFFVGGTDLCEAGEVVVVVNGIMDGGRDGALVDVHPSRMLDVPATVKTS